MTPTIVFHVDLIQDVAILRPLARLARDHPAERRFLVSTHFRALDATGAWFDEVSRIAAETGAEILTYETPFDACRLLEGRAGLCIAGSESNAAAHGVSHRLFQVLPSGFLRVTLQHGFECLGFLHNRSHAETFGTSVRFAADLIVGWFERTMLRDVPPTEAAKLYVAGPPTLIGRADRRAGEGGTEPYLGLVCENVHSVRFGAESMRLRVQSMVTTLARRFGEVGVAVHLRPHPAGSFLAQRGHMLNAPITAIEGPLYAVDLGRYAYAISAPSTVLFDLVLADVPVAVWAADALDATNYAGLPTVVDGEQCFRFAIAATVARDALLREQRAFLERLPIPAGVEQRYAALLALAGT